MRKERVMAITEDGFTSADDSPPTPPVQQLEEGGGGFASSVVDVFQRELAELADAQSVFIPVKGYEQTGLQIQYRMPTSGKELAEISTKVNRQFTDAYSRNL